MANLQYTDDNWLGETPPTWPVVPAKSLFSNPVERNHGDDIHLTPSQKYGVLPQADYMEITGGRVVLNLSGADNMRHVEPGDFVSHLRSFQGGLEYSPYRGKVSAAYTVLRPKLQIEPRFYKYLFKSSRYVQGLATTTEQLRDGQSIRYEQFALLRLPYPPIEEQRAIADFLDRELNTLDSAIASQEKLVGLLIERRLATIQAAIQESSDLTGSVIAPLKWHARLRTGGTPSDAQYTAETADGVPWLRPDDLDESGNPSRGTRFFDKASLVGIGMTTPGSILLCCIGATLGKAGIVLERVAFNQQITSITSSLNPRYLHYQLVTKKQDLKNLSMGNTLPILNNDRLGTLKIVIPTAENQASIVRFLDVQTRSMDTAIQKARNLISALAERRQTLISAAITGKIDVSGKN